MRKRKGIGKDFVILRLEDLSDDDFECLDSNPLNGSSNFSNSSSSDDDWSIVDDNVGTRDVTNSSPSSSHVNDNGVVQRKKSSPPGCDLVTGEVEYPKTEVIREVPTTVEDWFSVGESSSEGVASENLLINVAKSPNEEKSCAVSEEKKFLDKVNVSEEFSSRANFIFENNLAKELLLDCVKFADNKRHAKEIEDGRFGEEFGFEDETLFPYVEISDSDSEHERVVSEGRGDPFAEEMFFPDVESLESEFENGEEDLNVDEDSFEKVEGVESDVVLEKVAVETDAVDCGEVTQEVFTFGDQAERHGDPSRTGEENEDNCEEQYDEQCEEEDFCCVWCDELWRHEFHFESQYSGAENFLPTNDLYDFFPDDYRSQKFDRYGSRLRKKQKLVLDSEKRWKKLYYHH